jgi:8-oxo-dGTP pyrophosphatase MutT (NUDIX family)
MRFLGGFYVFPGGSIEPQDRSKNVLARCRGLAPEEAEKLLGNTLGPELAVAHWIAGIRELFEEVGIVLLSDASGAEVRSDSRSRERFEETRRAIVTGASDFGEFLEAENLYIDLRRAVYFAHRITPDGFPYRFDTRFYLAALPDGHSALESSEEVAHALWIAPAAALKEANKNLPLLPPTTTMLQTLSGYGSWKSLCEKFSFV